MRIDVVIPVLNEEATIGKLLDFLQTLDVRDNQVKIIVVDGGSTDRTVEVVETKNVICVKSTLTGRAHQLNLGAKSGNGDVLYFLHSDTFPPDSLFSDLSKAIKQGCVSGCFRLKFDFDHWFLRMNAWFTRFRFTPFRFGDQSLFVTREMFESLGGYDESLTLLEDNAMATKLIAKGNFMLIQKPVITSARKYVKYGVFKLQFLYYVIYVLYFLGSSQTRLKNIYKSVIS